MNIAAEVRFWAKVRKTSTCWLWLGAIHHTGYGQFWFEGCAVFAHRWAYEQWVGPIPDGLELDHKCRIRHCVRPAHLEPVTNHENIRRGRSGQHQSAKTHCPAEHPYSGDNLYLNPTTGKRECRACNAERTRQYRRRQKELAA